MNITDELNKMEARYVEYFNKLSAWENMGNLDKIQLSNLLVWNYCYSVYFQEIMTVAQMHAISIEARTAIEHIIDEEHQPKLHTEVYKDTLEACGLTIPNFKLEGDSHVLYHKMLNTFNISIPNITDIATKGTALKQLVKKSLDYAQSANDYEELGMLCFFRLGAEILPGKFYEELLKVVTDRFAVQENEIKFILLHKEHDCSKTNLGVNPKEKKDYKVGYYPHADHFNKPITDLVNKIGEKAIEIAKGAYEDAYGLRKAYLEELTSGLQNKFQGSDSRLL